MISSAFKELSTGALLGYVFRRAPSNSPAVISPKILTGVAIGFLQQSDSSFDTSQVTLGQNPCIFPVSEELCCDGVR